MKTYIKKIQNINESDISLRKKKKWPLVAAVLLLLVCGSTYYAYTNGYLEAYLKPSENTNTDNTDKEKKDTKNTEKPKDTNKTNTKEKTEDNSSNTTDDKKTETNTNSGNKNNNSNNSGTGNNKPSTNNSGSGNNSGNSGSSGNNTGCTWVDKKVLVSEGHYEQRLVKAAWSEWIETKPAWTEEDTYCYAWGQDQVEIYVCNQCGAKFYSGGDANNHISGSQTCGGWHNDYELQGEPHCKEWKTEYINHPAEGYYQNHPAEYESVWVDAVYKTERVCE